MKLSDAMARWPVMEVSAKLVYAHTPMGRLGGRLRYARALNQGVPPEGDAKLTEEAARAALVKFLHSNMVGAGDVILLHSGNTVSNALGFSAVQLIDFFMDFVGSGGTLVMPTIPVMKGEPRGSDRYQDGGYNRILDFDTSRSAPWTGIVPRQLIQTPGVLRGRNPFNNVSALGASAERLFVNELNGPLQTPCGPGSAWEVLEQLNPFILAINCRFAHSVTMIHRVEEADPNNWVVPADRWYRSRRVRINDRGRIDVVELRERRAKWSAYFCERSLEHRLFDEGVVDSFAGGGLQLTGCRAQRLLDWARKQAADFPYWIPRVMR